MEAGVRRVLLIEDDAHLLQAMALAFEQAGYEVEQAVEGDEGLWLFDRQAADLVVTDIVLPGRDGMEVIRTVRRQRLHTRIVAISGGYRGGPEDYLTIASHLGADAVLAKPFRMDTLVETAKRLLANA